MTSGPDVWGGASGHTYTVARRPSGATGIDVVVVRDGNNFEGRVIGFMPRTIGRGIFPLALAAQRWRLPARWSSSHHFTGSGSAVRFFSLRRRAT
jgi:hypothetical protein